MHADEATYRQFFQALLTDPDAAAPTLEAAGDADASLLTSIGAQNAVLAAYASMPTASQIRSLAKTMRRRYDEAIDSFALTVLIGTVCKPNAAALHRQLETIDARISRRMAFLLPHGLACTGLIPPEASATYAMVSATHYTEARERLQDELGEDVGGFYRIVCVEPAEAAQYLLGDRDLTEDHRYAKSSIAALRALVSMWPDGPPQPHQVDRFWDHMRRSVDLDRAEVTKADLQVLIDTAFGGHAPDQAPLHGKHYALALAIPATMVALTGMSVKGIVAFAKDCRRIEAHIDAGTA